ncbi:MAG: DNA polymerase III subunit delta [Erysipelotrichaceae bacterium]|nr:DNA polymerase III subunit delta [Erysipelotrichaceae bacterium]
MIYILQGQEPLFIKEKIDEIVSSSEGELYSFDGSDKELSIASLMEACEGNSLFSNGTIVLVDQPFFLIKKCDERQLQELLDYVKKPLYDTQLVFYTYADNFNSKLKIYKQIAANAQVIDLKHLDYKNFSNYVRSRITEEKLDITSDALYLLNSICKRDATLFNANLEVLKLYPGKIDPKAVNKLCTASDDNDSFDMINALTNKDLSKAVNLERKLMSQSDSIFGVIGLLANQLRFLYQIAYYESQNRSRKEILEITGANEYRLNKANDTLNILKKEKIIELLKKLSDLDITLKSDNSISDQSRFELFLLEFLKKV